MVKAIRFSKVLTQQAVDLEGSTKRVVTHARVLAATARQLEAVGYTSLTVKDIVSDAQMARGTFYLYFENCSFAAEAVMIAYFTFLSEGRPHIETCDTFDRILQSNLYYVSTYARNAALLACIEPLSRERSAFKRFREKNNHNWCQRVIQDFESHFAEAAQKANTEVKTLLVWSMSAMVDELLREIYISKSARHKKLAKKPEQVAELISLAWFRAFYAQDVPAGKLKWTKSLTTIKRLGRDV